MERINSGLKKYKNNGVFLYTRALVAEQINRLDILESDLKKLIDMEPRNAQALNALGYTWANKNINLLEADKYIDMALKIAPNDAAILDSKGWVLYRLGKFKKSENYFIRALKISDDAEIVSHYIKVLIKLKKIQKAKKIYAKYIKNHPSDDKLIEIKKILNEI
jgi:tetratricopeptide (TPR) repeat protein